MSGFDSRPTFRYLLAQVLHKYKPHQYQGDLNLMTPKRWAHKRAGQYKVASGRKGCRAVRECLEALARTCARQLFGEGGSKA